MTKEALVSGFEKLRGIVDGIRAFVDMTNADETLTSLGKSERIARYIDGSGLVETRDELASALGEYAEQVRDEQTARIIGYLKDGEHQAFVSRAVEAVELGAVDALAAAAIADELKADPVALRKLGAAMTVEGAAMFELPKAESVPNFEGMASTLRNEITPAGVKVNGAVLSLLLDEHRERVGGFGGQA